jgi:hypothetical protein
MATHGRLSGAKDAALAAKPTVAAARAAAAAAARSTAAAARAAVVAHYEAEIAKCDDGTPESIAGPLLSTAAKLKVLQEEFRNKVSPLVTEARELQRHLYRELTAETGVSAEIAISTDTFSAPPRPCVLVPGSRPGEDPMVLRLVDCGAKGMPIDAVLVNSMFACTPEEFAKDAAEVTAKRAAALARWRASQACRHINAAIKTKRGGSTRGSTRGRGRGRGRGGAAAHTDTMHGSLRTTPRTFVSRSHQAAALAQAAWESAEVHAAVPADMDAILRASRRQTEPLDGSVIVNDEEASHAATLAREREAMAAVNTMLPDELDPVNPPGHVPLRDTPLTMLEMYCEVMRLRAKRLHCPTKTVMKVTKRPPPGYRVVPAGDDIAAVAQQWQRVLSAVKTGRAANRTARAPHLIATSVCNRHLQDMLADKDPAFVFRAPIAAVPASAAAGAGAASILDATTTQYHVAISLRPKERLVMPVTLDVLADFVRQVADKHVGTLPGANEPFHPARHTAPLVSRTNVIVLADVADALAEFYRKNTVIDHVVQCKRVAGPAPAADAVTGLGITSRVSGGNDDDDYTDGTDNNGTDDDFDTDDDS